MSKMAELHYEREQEMQEDCPEIEYYSIYDYFGKWTPTLENWYNKKYANPKNHKPKFYQYVGFDKEVRLPF